LSATLPALSSSAVAAARNATLELLMGALRAEGETPTTSAAQPALRAAMDRYIERQASPTRATSPAASKPTTAPRRASTARPADPFNYLALRYKSLVTGW
jgi:hypothetical protein